jgi:cell division protein FtsB
MSLARGPLFVVHGVFATVVVLGLWMHLEQREQDVERLRVTAQQEHVETTTLEAEISQQQALIDGLRAKDPYVIEMIARDKLNYVGAGEISPPPLPSIDKSKAISTK